MRTVEKIGPAYEVEMVREGDKLVEVTIKATGDTPLGYDELREATRQILHRTRPERHATELPLRLNSDAMRALKAAHEAGQRPSSDEYLARLAVTYEEQAPIGRDPAVRIATVLGVSPQTIKQHLVKARKDGFLSPTAEGQKGGEATEKARRVVAAGKGQN